MLYYYIKHLTIRWVYFLSFPSNFLYSLPQKNKQQRLNISFANDSATVIDARVTDSRNGSLNNRWQN
jgi:hypothetical protein